MIYLLFIYNYALHLVVHYLYIYNDKLIISKLGLTNGMNEYKAALNSGSFEDNEREGNVQGF